MSMYIYANLPEPYGTFNKIREDNYPFNRLFPKYLRTLVTLARGKDLDVFSLLGYIENELSEGERLPDLPVSEERLSFRFSIEDKLIEDYYREQDLTNKMITQMIIRTTIRLSQVYGTSLSRIGALITNIDDGKDEHKQIKIREKKKPIPKNVKISKPKEDDDFNVEEASRGDLLEQIDRLTKKGSELVSRVDRKEETPKEEDDTDISADSDDKVVETNPYLMDFL